MLMDHKIRITAYGLPIFIKTTLCMFVKVQALQRTYRLLFGYSCHLGIAILCMGMLWNATPGFLHRNSGHNQRIDGTEYHHAGKTSHDFSPNPAMAVLTGVAIRFPYNIFLQLGFPPSYSTRPSRFSGQTRKMILPTICSSATQPTAVFRESTEVDR